MQNDTNKTAKRPGKIAKRRQKDLEDGKDVAKDQERYLKDCKNGKKTQADREKSAKRPEKMPKRRPKDQEGY